jgi:hypothetical protein
MNNMLKPFLFAATFFTSGVCWAQANALPSCYNSKIIDSNRISNTELFVIVDQTTMLDNQLKQQLADQIRPFLIHGNSVSVTVFSSFNQGKYTRVVAKGRIEHKLPDAIRADISKPLLAKFDECLNSQPSYANQLVGAALRYAFEGTSTELAKSDIFSSLKEISSMVRSAGAKNKLVLLSSDMLENSSISSFYQNQSVRLIDPEKELNLVVKHDLFADFAGARVYVLGTGLIPEDSKGNKNQYRDPKTMAALSAFWMKYFSKSNGELMELGKPALLNPIR